MIAELLSLLVFASKWSGLPISPYSQPKVVIASEYQGYKLGPQCEQYALTDTFTQTIYMSKYDPNSIIDRCLLAHELTHYLQAVNHVRGDASVLEPPAYRVEAECFRESNNPEEAKWATYMEKHFNSGKYFQSAKKGC